MRYTHVFHTTLPSDEITRFINEMPKTEIHVHLEGATSPELLFKMASRNNIALPVKTLHEWTKFYEFRDFNHFIEVYLLSVSCMKTRQDFSDMVVDFMARQKKQNIIYSEVFFSAALHLGHIQADEILNGLYEGIQIGRKKFGIDIMFIPDISREECYQNNSIKDVLEFALKAKDMGIGIGLGIAGKEIGFPSAFFADIFSEARRQGLHVVAHAGETGDHRIVRDVIEVLKPERIGHGIGALGDSSLVKLISRNAIPVEVSPQSNYCTKVVGLENPHPIRQMLDAGMFCNVNSDDPSMFSTDLGNEYMTLASQGFSLEELWKLNINGLQATFLPAGMKNKMIEEWEKWHYQMK